MREHTTGFAYVEVLVAAVVLAIALIPASDAFRAASRQAELSREMLLQHYRALASLEVTQTRTFGQLVSEANSTSGTTPSTWSDASGSAYRRLVYVARFDFDNADNDNNDATGVDNGVIRIRVLVEGTPINLYAIASNRT